ncbi:MAG: C10 family peptidase [Muribaculaceae bacterium]|nr:C10 family peptidase [Muribaculaceae bacterium]
MNKIFTLFTTLALGAAAASAAVISPEQALDRALQGGGSQARAAAAVDMQLAQTTLDPATGEATVYVFAATDNQPGFIVAAANDAYPHALLGYSDESLFDATNVSPDFQWWLNTMGKAVAQSETVQPKGFTVRRAAKDDIAPIVKTKWNQSAPYNNMCPIVSGQRSVTGCVATAMAQLMNVWAWPKQAQGGSVTLQGVTVNFNESVYDWANMKNTYSTYTQAQADAVAKLMLDCGFACNMNYSPTGSGASDFIAAQGMVKYFNYDKHLQYIQRDWFSDSEWADVIYKELQEGRPVMICGNDGTVGHAFVCSGFQMQRGTELFHINWGWGGYCDGYFLITDLDPDGSGIGGGSGDAGYNRGNTAIIGIQDPVEGHELIPTMYCGDVFAAGRTKYDRTGTTLVSFPTTIYSVSMGDLSIVLGLKLVSADGTTRYIDVRHYNLATGYGFVGFDVPSMLFPVGSYDIYPVCSTEKEYSQGIWYPVYTQNGTMGYTHFDVTENAITVTGDQPTPEFNISFYEVSPEGTWYRGTTYDVTLLMRSNVEYTGDVSMILYKNNMLYEMSDLKTISLPDPSQAYTATWTITIPNDIDLGRYTLGLATEQDNIVYPIEGASTTIDVIEDPSKGVANVTNVLFVGSSSRGTVLSRPASMDFNNEIKVGLSCTAGTWNETLTGLLLDVNSGAIMGQTTSVPLVLNEGESISQALNVDAELGKSLHAGTTYQFVPFAVNRGNIPMANNYYVKFTGKLSGVEMVNPDDDASAPVEYYNLQGIRISNPQDGQMLIRRQGSTASKVRF